jgi:hypothetical protein
MKNWKGLLFGITYGLLARGLFALELSDNTFLPTYGMMTFSFMFIVPLVVGLYTAYHFDTITKASKVVVITMPLFSMIGVVAILVLFGKEGIICALMAIPIFALMSLIGGFIGVKLFKRRKDKLLEVVSKVHFWV